MASLSEILELSRGRRQRRRLPFLVLALIAFGVGGAATTALNKTGIADWMLSRASAPSLIAQRSFPVCAGTVRITCVVDGDTFWLDEVKYRVADINTPEIGQPQCAREATLGREATSRFAQLLYIALTATRTSMAASCASSSAMENRWGIFSWMRALPTPGAGSERAGVKPLISIMSLLDFQGG
jgi:hypothetical protein